MTTRVSFPSRRLRRHGHRIRPDRRGYLRCHHYCRSDPRRPRLSATFDCGQRPRFSRHRKRAAIKLKKPASRQRRQAFLLVRDAALTDPQYRRHSLRRSLSRMDPAWTESAVMIEAIKLLLFPAMMAFAASSDLLTMKIPNRVSLIMIGGFVLLAVATGMSLEQIRAACRRRPAGAGHRFRILRPRLDRRRRRQARGRDRVVVRLRASPGLRALRRRSSAAR